MELLRAADHRRMPWKNGGGETFEIAVAPAGAPLDAIEWRLSMAVVAADGPFSLFPGVDRTLTILDGAGIELAVGAKQALFPLTRESTPFHFPADVPSGARLLAGAVTDFNVMTRRDRYRHSVRRQVMEGRLELATAGDQVALFCIDGSVECTPRAATAAVHLQARDCALFREPPRRLQLNAQPAATVLLVEFYLTTA